jgi:hypothetical protein
VADAGAEGADTDAPRRAAAVKRGAVLDPRWTWTDEELRASHLKVETDDFFVSQRDCFQFMTSVCRTAKSTAKAELDANKLVMQSLVLWQRYHAVKPLDEDRIIVACASVLVMSKALELPISVKECVAGYYVFRHWKLEIDSQQYLDVRDRLLTNERKLLHVTGYDTTIDLPSDGMLRILQRRLHGGESLFQRAQVVVRQMITSTHLCLMFPARALAQGAVFFASKHLRLELPVGARPTSEASEEQPWWSIIEVSWPVLRVVCWKLLESMVRVKTLSSLSQAQSALKAIEASTRAILEARDSDGDPFAVHQEMDRLRPQKRPRSPTSEAK